MSKIVITQNELDEAGKITLLPIEEEREINGLKKMVKLEYVAEITSVKEMNSKQGNPMLKMAFAIDYANERVYTDVYFTLNNKFGKKILGRLVDMFKLDGNNLDTDDFLGKYVIVNIAYEEYEVPGQTDENGQVIKQTRNKIANFVRAPKPDELVVPPTDGKTPF
jgi:hypothetical protein